LRCEQSASGPHGGLVSLNALALDGFNLSGGQQRACIHGPFATLVFAALLAFLPFCESIPPATQAKTRAKQGKIISV